VALVALGWIARGVVDVAVANATVASYLSREVGKAADGRVVRIGDVIDALVAEKIQRDLAAAKGQ